MASTDGTPSPTQRRVLVALKRRGDATADELASALDISASAVRQHLSALRSAGLIAARPDRGHPGRPADRYHATELTESLFVGTQGSLSIELLEHVEEEDPELVGRVFERRRHRLVEEARERLQGKPVDEQVAVLSDLLDSQGFLADADALSDTRYRINLHSCAIWPVANRYRQACTAELDFIRDLIPGATVERVTHKTEGAHTCTYEITLEEGISTNPGLP
ncbi:helix-turn-helix transcriptional regulator [Rhabdothermincola salaria]|uniref:helix-turn-helix transcriptional regulator n=1 Tax=Rhabdothermincola salaria TaxID=2903142 RepID=UPI001E548014|nr:ArsR family transcriptional regulator [Rhabdothermincola salaria]